jgi:glycosyltransferase involved in cell wall biosynthesis
MRIFIGLFETAGFFSRLKKGFDKIGVESFLFNYTHKFSYQNASEVRYGFFEKASCYFDNKRANTSVNNITLKILYIFLRSLFGIPVFIKAIVKFDVFIFSFGTSFFPYNLELPIYRLLGKKTFFVFTGSDHRPPYINGVFTNNSENYDIRKIRRITASKKRQIKRIEKYSNLTIGHHLSAQFHEKPFIPILLLGIPVEISHEYQYDFIKDDVSNKPVRIVHAPSNPMIKGTETIRNAIKNLKDKGYKIDYQELINKTNKEVLDILQNCDFVVDELYSDTRMAGLAAEAAMFSKPVIVCGYASDHYYNDTKLGDNFPTPPVKYCDPLQVENTIKEFIINPDLRTAIGIKARAFIDKNWQAQTVAEKFMKILSGNISEEWFYEPSDLTYIYGMGAPLEHTKKIVRELIFKYGISSLKLEDKPQMEQAFLEFIRKN